MNRLMASTLKNILSDYGITEVEIDEAYSGHNMRGQTTCAIKGVSAVELSNALLNAIITSNGELDIFDRGNLNNLRSDQLGATTMIY